MVAFQWVWSGARVAGIGLLLLGCSSSEAAKSEGGAVVPCGGNLVGGWASVDEHAPLPQGPDVNSCWNLMGSYAGTNYAASTRYPSAERRETFLRFEADGVFISAQQLKGIVTLKYAPECLVTAQGTPTCAELQTALHTSGISEGAYFDTLCSDQAGGGCTCTVRVQEVGALVGNWSIDSSGKAVTLTRNTGQPEPEQLTVDYCSNASGLRFGAGIDTWLRDTEGDLFAPVDCTDGKQGLGEEGIDCGFLCPDCARP
jgi:hypothetical protein